MTVITDRGWDEVDDGVYDVTVGEVVDVDLRESAGGGGSWSCAVPVSAAGRLQLVSSRAEPATAAPVGSCPIRRFVFRATGVGTTTVRFEQRRPSDAAATDRRDVVIHAEPC